MTASRSIANAHEQHGGEPADAARAEAERLREAAWALGLTARTGPPPQPLSSAVDGRVAAPRAFWRRSRSWPSASPLLGRRRTALPSSERRRRARRRHRAASATATATAKPSRRQKRKRKTYIVKAGDTPSAIAEKTGVPLDGDRARSTRPRPAGAAARAADQAAPVSAPAALARGGVLAPLRRRCSRRAPRRGRGACPTVSAPSAILIEARPATSLCAARADAARARSRSTTKLMTALLDARARRSSSDAFRAAATTPRPPSRRSGCAPGERMTVADLLRGAAARVGQRRRRDAGRAASAARARRSCALMNRARARARADATRTTRTRSGSTSRATTRPRATSSSSRACCARNPFFRRTVGTPQRHAAQPATTRARSTTATTLIGRAVGQRRQDRPHAAGRLRAGRLGRAQRRPARQRRCSATPSDAARDADTLRAAEYGFAATSASRAARARRRSIGDACRSATAAARRSSSSPARTVERGRARGSGRPRDARRPRVPSEVEGPIRRGAAARHASRCAPAASVVAASRWSPRAAVPAAGFGAATKAWFTQPAGDPARWSAASLGGTRAARPPRARRAAAGGAGTGRSRSAA